MEISIINNKNVPDEALALIPRELFFILKSPNVRIYGAEFMDELCGILIWKKESEETGRLLCINVDFAARELGLVTVDEAYSKLANNDILKRAEGNSLCKNFEEPTPAEKNLIIEWIGKNTDIPAEIYLEGSPCLAVIKNNEVRGIMLFKEIYHTSLSLECCFQAPGEVFALPSMLCQSLEILSVYPAKYNLRMVLANEQSEKIYSDYFGEPEDEVVQCKGYCCT